MIDPRDQGTQQLQLEQKRGRGRPATGQALSNAERQRLYRERQKAQRNEKMHQAVAEDLRGELANAIRRAELAEARADAMGNELAIVKAQLSSPARKKRHRDEPAAELPEDKTYTLQARTGSGKWLNLVSGIYGEEASRQLDRVIDNKLLGTSKNRQYRLVEDRFA